MDIEDWECLKYVNFMVSIDWICHKFRATAVRTLFDGIQKRSDNWCKYYEGIKMESEC